MELIMMVMIFTGLGLLFLYLGYLLYYKQRIEVMHDYHYTKVSDKKGYTKTMGIGLVIIGTGSLLSALLTFFPISLETWIPFIAAVMIGIAVLVYGQIKYNKGIF